jgi:hypothetical protein
MAAASGDTHPDTLGATMTRFRVYNTDELDEMPDAALRDLDERMTAHRNKIRSTRTALSAPARLGSPMYSWP